MLSLISSWNMGLNLNSKSARINQLKHYNQLKIISAQINYTGRTTFLPSVFVFFCFTNISGTFLSILCLRAGSLFNNFGNLIYLLISLETYLGIVCFTTLPGILNGNSTRFLRNLKKFRGENICKFFTKSVNACNQLKIRFSDNFVGVLTPLVMISLCIKWTSKLLLVTR